jgi:hypothetical protein
VRICCLALADKRGSLCPSLSLSLSRALSVSLSLSRSLARSLSLSLSLSLAHSLSLSLSPCLSLSLAHTQSLSRSLALSHARALALFLSFFLSFSLSMYIYTYITSSVVHSLHFQKGKNLRLCAPIFSFFFQQKRRKIGAHKRGPPLHVKKCSKVLSIVPLHSKCIRAMTFENLYQARARTLGSHSPHVQKKKTCS